MKRIRRIVLVLVIAVGVSASWDRSAMTEAFTSVVDAVRTSVEGVVAAPIAPLPPSAAGDKIAVLLQDVHVLSRLPDVRGYERGCKRHEACSFGPAWNDPQDHSGCDTRSRILKAQLADVVIKPKTQNCKVLSGTLHDPYTGSTVFFDAAADPSGVQIDHVFALGRSWDAGAWTWDQKTRVKFANDPENLIAVPGTVNREKSDSGLAWLPPNRDFQCTYIARYLAIAVKYGLSISAQDRDVAAGRCPPVSQGA